MPNDPLPAPAPQPSPRLALRPREAALSLGVSERTLWALTASGQIPHCRAGKRLLYPVALLNQWLVDQAEGGTR